MLTASPESEESNLICRSAASVTMSNRLAVKQRSAQFKKYATNTSGRTNISGARRLYRKAVIKTSANLMVGGFNRGEDKGRL